MSGPRLLAGAPAAVGAFAKCLVPTEEPIRFAVVPDRLAVSGLEVEGLEAAFDFLLVAVQDKEATDVERAEALFTLLGPNWDREYGEGLTPQDLLNRLAFALGRTIEDKAVQLSSWVTTDDT